MGSVPPLGEIVIGTIHNTAHLASAVGAESAELGGDFIHIVQDLPGIGCKVIEDNEGMTIENGGMSVQPVDGHCAAEPIDLDNLLSFRTGQQTDLLIVFVIAIDLAAGVLPDQIPLPVKESEVGKADRSAVGIIDNARGFIHAGGIAESQNIFVAPVQGVFAARESFLRQGDGLQHLILPAQGGEGIAVLEG